MDVVAALQEFLARPPVPDAPDPKAVEAQVLELFHRVARTVPAYGDFLARHGVEPAGLRTLDSFEGLPLTTKQTYHVRYPLPDLCRDGRLDGCDMIAVSSGSTGRPTYWPRFVTDELQVAARFEQVFAGGFGADR